MATKYRFIGLVSPEQRIDQVQIGNTDKVLTLHDPTNGRFGNAETLTDAQADELRSYVVLEEVPEELSGEYVFGAEEGGQEAASQDDSSSGSSSSSKSTSEKKGA